MIQDDPFSSGGSGSSSDEDEEDSTSRSRQGARDAMEQEPETDPSSGGDSGGSSGGSDRTSRSQQGAQDAREREPDPISEPERTESHAETQTDLSDAELREYARRSVASDSVYGASDLRADISDREVIVTPTEEAMIRERGIRIRETVSRPDYSDELDLISDSIEDSGVGVISDPADDEDLFRQYAEEKVQDRSFIVLDEDDLERGGGGGITLDEDASARLEDAQLENIGREIGVSADEIVSETKLTYVPGERGGQYKKTESLRLTESGQRKLLEKQIEEQYPDREYDIVEEDGELQVEFEAAPEDRDTRIGQFAADVSFDIQQGAESLGGFIREETPGEGFSAPLSFGGETRMVTVDERPGDVLGGAAEFTVKTLDPAGAALDAYDIGEAGVSEVEEVTSARYEAAQELANMSFDEAVEDPKTSSGLFFDATVLPRDYASDRAGKVAGGATEIGTTVQDSFVENPVQTVFTGTTAAIGSVVVPSGAAQGTVRGTRVAKSGLRSVDGVTSISRGAKVAETLSEVKLQTPTVRVVRDADSPLLDVTPGARQQLSDLTDISHPGTNVSRSRLGADDISSRIRGELQGIGIDAEIASRRVRQRVRETPENVADLTQKQASQLTEEIEGITKGAALSAEATRFNVGQRISRGARRPDVDFELADRIADFRGSVSDEIVAYEQSALLEAERQAFRARQGISNRVDTVRETPTRIKERGIEAGQQARDRIEAIPRNAAIEAEVRLRNQQRRIEGIQQRIESIPDRLESGVETQRSRLDAFQERVESLPTEASLEAEAKVFNARQRVGGAVEKVESTALDAARFPDELTIRVEPGRPPKQQRVIDVTESDIDIVSGPVSDISDRTPQGRVSGSGGSSGQQALIKLDDPISEQGALARDDLSWGRVETVSPAVAGANLVAEYDATPNVDAEPGVSDVDSGMSVSDIEADATGSTFDIDEIAEPSIDEGSITTTESTVYETDESGTTSESGAIEFPGFGSGPGFDSGTVGESVTDIENVQTAAGEPRPPGRGTRVRPFVPWPDDDVDTSDDFGFESDLESDDWENPVSENPFEDMATDLEEGFDDW